MGLKLRAVLNEEEESEWLSVINICGQYRRTRKINSNANAFAVSNCSHSQQKPFEFQSTDTGGSASKF